MFNRLALLALLSFCFDVFSSDVVADQRALKTEDNSKIDAVLLLDASGSMLRTDPQRLRDEGAKLFVTFLKPGDRIAVMQFDSSASLIRPFSEFKTEEQAAIGADIAKVGTAGTYTDLLSGVKAAAELLEKEKRPDAHGMIVLLSDGKMEPDPNVGMAYPRTEELLNQILPDVKAKGEKVYTLCFSELADKALLSEIAVATEGIGWFAPDAGKIHESFADLFLAVKKPQVVPLTGKGFTIDGDVQEATFYVNREEGAELTLVDPSGVTYLPGTDKDAVKWFRGQKFDVITIKEPTPGNWRVTGLTSNDGFATVLTNLKLVSDWPTTLVAEESALLQARLNEGDKPVVLPEMSGATRYGLQIIPTDKVAEPIVEDVLFDDGTHGDKIAGDGIFSYKVALEEPGEYKLWIVAKGPTFDRRQQIPFRVKPPLISLAIVQAEEDSGEHGHAAPAPAHGGHDAAHEGGEHGEKGGHDEVAPAHHEAGEDLVQIRLSPEALLMKNIEVKLSAVDDKRRKMNLTVEKGLEESIYEFATSKLPEGVYEFRAVLTAESKKRGQVKEESRAIKYKREKSTNEPVIEVVVEEQKPPVEKPSALPYAGIAFVVNALLGFVAFSILKKAQGGSSFELPAFSSPEVALAGISELENRNALQELNFDDPILKNEVVLPTPSSAVAAQSGGAASPPPSAAVTQPPESGETAEPVPSSSAEANPPEEGSPPPEEEPKS